MSFWEVDKINVLNDLTILSISNTLRENALFYLESNALKPKNILHYEN